MLLGELPDTVRGPQLTRAQNRVPDDLYHHGVQRERMAGFLDALKGRCEVVELDGGRDWRRIGEGDKDDKWVTLDDNLFDAAWAAERGGEPVPRDLVVYGRRVRVPATKGDACMFPFDELCETALGPADYLTLASTFRTFYIDAVPILLLKHKNEARRLINLIDALCKSRCLRGFPAEMTTILKRPCSDNHPPDESRCQLYVRAAERPEHLFFPDALDPALDPEHHQHREMDALEAEALSETLAAQPRANVSVYNPKTRIEREKLDRADLGSSFAVMGIFTGEDERFAYVSVGSARYVCRSSC